MNTDLFSSRRKPNTKNAAGGQAYSMKAEEALAQFAVTGRFQDGYYTSAEMNLDTMRDLASQCSEEFLAKCAVYARNQAWTRDMPSALLAILFGRASAPTVNPDARKYFLAAWPLVITGVGQLRKFFQMVRSGQFGRKGFGNMGKRLMQEWFDSKRPDQLFRMNIGTDPKLGDVLKMAHPSDQGDEERKQVYRWLIGKDFDYLKGPDVMRSYFQLTKGEAVYVPRLPIEMYEGLLKGPEQWAQAAIEHFSWKQLLKNLARLDRQEVFKNREWTKRIAEKLADKEQVAKFEAYPFTIMNAVKQSMVEQSYGYRGTQAVAHRFPTAIVEALEDAMEETLKSVPNLGNILLGVDCSGSMRGGYYRSEPGTLPPIDVAAALGAGFVRYSDSVTPYLFDTSAYPVDVSASESVLSVARKFNRGGGATDCSVVLRQARRQYPGKRFDAIVIISDGESWARSGRVETALMEEYRQMNGSPKLVCIDVIERADRQADSQGKNIFCIGGHGQAVFEALQKMTSGGIEAPKNVVDIIRQVELDLTQIEPA